MLMIVRFCIATSEFESNDFRERFRLLVLAETALFEYMTVGVMVRELIPFLVVAFSVDEIEVETKLMLTGDFGSSGKKELVLFAEELGIFDNLDFGCRLSLEVVFRLAILCSRCG